MAGITATTTAPGEVRRLFDEYAGILEMYGNDQLAMVRRNLGKTKARVRAELYFEIAAEMREIKFTVPDGPREIVGEEREAFLKANGYKE